MSETSLLIDLQVNDPTAVNIVSNNTFSHLAKTGDELTISINYDENVSLPVVTLHGNSATESDLGNNKFRMHSLPIQAQWAPVYSIISHDFDDDSFQDLMVVGNDYGVETKQGRADALNGLIFKNKKGKGFSFVDIDKTNLFIDKDAKSLVKLNVKDK